MKGMYSDIHRMFWFADANDADADWNQFDGLISLFLDASATIGATRFVDMEATSFQTSDVLATDGAYGIMKQLYSAQTAELRQVPVAEKKFYVTNTIWDNLMDTYEDLNSSTGLLRLIDGGKMYFRGIEVVSVPEWSSSLADSTNPHYTGSGLGIGSNLVVYTAPANIVIGTDVTSPTSEFKVRYNDDDDELMKVVAKFKLGAQFVHESLVALAY